MTSYGTLPVVSKGNMQVCVISFDKTDRISLIAMSEEMTHDIREAILKGWGPIKEEREHFGAHEFKLKGNPWTGHSKEAVKSRRLLATILEVMALKGWNLLQAVDICKKQNDKDTLFFEYGQPDPEAHLFAMSFNERDAIRVIDAPDCMPLVKEAVIAQWPLGIHDESFYHGSMALELRGVPWCPQRSANVSGRKLLCQIIANMRAHGYKLYGSIDISNGIEGMDLESWVFRKITAVWH